MIYHIFLYPPKYHIVLICIQLCTHIHHIIEGFVLLLPVLSILSSSPNIPFKHIQTPNLSIVSLDISSNLCQSWFHPIYSPSIPQLFSNQTWQLDISKDWAFRNHRTTLWLCQTQLLKMTTEMVSFPMKNGDFPQLCSFTRGCVYVYIYMTGDFQLFPIYSLCILIIILVGQYIFL